MAKVSSVTGSRVLFGAVVASLLVALGLLLVSPTVPARQGARFSCGAPAWFDREQAREQLMSDDGFSYERETAERIADGCSDLVQTAQGRAAFALLLGVTFLTLTVGVRSRGQRSDNLDG